MANAKRPDRQSGRASRNFLRFIEEHGIALRERVGLGPEGRLDPFAAAPQFGIIVGNLDCLPELDQHDIQRLREISPRTWSGGAQELPDGTLHVLLNPNQTPERAVITVMEEVAHAYFGHQPTSLVLEPTGLMGRTFNEADED